MTSRYSRRLVHIVSSVLLFIIVLNNVIDIQAHALKKRDNTNDDYYFPESVNQEEADRLIAEQKAKEKAEAEERARLETTEKPPDFFKLEETDFSQLIDKGMAAEMLRKF